MVDLEDVALTAARVLLDADTEENLAEQHIGAIYELVGTEAMTPADMAAILAERLKRPVTAERVPISVWESAARKSGLKENQIDTLVKMFEYYEKYGFWGNSRVLSWLLNRPATSFEEFVMRELQARANVLQ